jgi:hypothetical protein
MKDLSHDELEKSRPNITALEGINFCLEQLYKDDKKLISDYIVHNFTFEELIGALLLARDELQKVSIHEEEFES